MTLKNYSFTFDPDKKGLRKILGHLETDVMELVWVEGEMTVRQVHKKLKSRRNIAYTTVMTVMSRLAEKGLLRKVKEGAAFVYRATSSREEFSRSTVRKVVNGLLGDFTEPAISQFVDSIGDSQPENMEELARLIEQKRKKKDV
ncbi:MAG: BlaI/MecI/CopY family transcriptional regulator [Ignavibacteria bacterium]|nr:BlaI/MecI/CopY family transcriptional regulator [Ignavibacteria bacterium]